MFMVPTQFIRLLDCAALRTTKLSSLRMCITAGSTMGVELKRKVMDAFGPCLHELYGFSEGGATIISSEELAMKPASAGRPTPGCDVRILGADDRVLPRNEPPEAAFWANPAHLAAGMSRVPMRRLGQPGAVPTSRARRYRSTEGS